MSKPDVPNEVQDRMLFAVDKFDEVHRVDAYGTPHDWQAATKEFWEAFAEWAPYALVGDFYIETTLDRTVRVRFEPKQ